MDDQKSTRLTDEELKDKERLMRTGNPNGFVKHGSGTIPEDFWDMPRPNISADAMLRALLEDREQGR